MKSLNRPFSLLFLLFLFTFSNSLIGQDIKGRKSFVMGFQIDGNKNKVIIPFESYNNLIVIPVVLNGAIPLKFILDTGVRTAILMDKKISDILKLPYTRTISLVGATGGLEVAAHVAPNISLSLPGVTGAGQALLVMEEDYLKLSETLGMDVHGIIGYEVFSRFIVEINYINNQIILYEPSEFRKRRKFKEFPIKVEDTKPYIFSQIIIKDNVSTESKLIIDTGASHSLLLHLESHDNFVLPSQTISTSLGRGLSGDIIGRVGRIDEIKFSNHKLHQIITSFPEEESFTEIIANTKRQGSIGGGILNRFDIVFDYSKEKIYVKKNAQFKRKSKYNMSGIELRAEGPDYKQLIVVEVLKGSPADLNGVKVGDEILMANNVWKQELSINFLNDLFKRRVNKKINLRIKRDDEVLKKNFRLKKII